jgi:hypothetical protein
MDPRADLDAVEKRKFFPLPGIERRPSSPYLSLCRVISTSCKVYSFRSSKREEARFHNPKNGEQRILQDSDHNWCIICNEANNECVSCLVLQIARLVFFAEYFAYLPTWQITWIPYS